ncbi:MAG: response regulator [Planctomycetota bacterium]|nr:MAG: response regulator [Planctomycetota bacterium]
MTDTKIVQHEAIQNRVVSQARTKRRKSQDSSTVQVIDEKGPREARILIVDEHYSVRQALTRLINEESGFTVAAEAENAEQALYTISTQQLDLVIVDRSLEINGRAGLAEKIKSNCPHVPVLVLPVSEFLEQ